jgi:[NiFe] hydrogenase assembly HybE family chaperone
MPDRREAAAADPSAALEAVYRRAGERMRGLGIVNEALAVEAVGFAPWAGHWLGVMVTPWFMNVVLAPRLRDAWPRILPGDKHRERLPAGEFEFIGAFEPDVGAFAIASLFSPVLEFEDHATARAVAAAAREALVRPQPRGREGHAGPLRRFEQALDGAQTRAEFVHGRLPGASA